MGADWLHKTKTGRVVYDKPTVKLFRDSDVLRVMRGWLKDNPDVSAPAGVQVLVGGLVGLLDALERNFELPAGPDVIKAIVESGLTWYYARATVTLGPTLNDFRLFLEATAKAVKDFLSIIGYDVPDETDAIAAVNEFLREEDGL